MTNYTEKPFEYTELPVDDTTPDVDVTTFLGASGAIRVVGGFVFLLRPQMFQGPLETIWLAGTAGFIRLTPDGPALSGTSLADDPAFQVG